MRKLLDFVLSVVLFLCFVVGGLALGHAAGLIFGSLSDAGWFTHWRALDSSMKFSEIVDASSQAIWARAENGKLYNWDLNCYHKCNVWIEVTSIPADLHMAGEQPMEKGNVCSKAPAMLGTPPGEMVVCARALYMGMEWGDTVYYALSKDGRLWVWQYSASMIQGFWLFLLCYVIGFALGIIAFVLFIKWWRRTRSVQSPPSEPNEATHGV